MKTETTTISAVIADGPVYESTVDNNVWEPGVYGWEKEE